MVGNCTYRVCEKLMDWNDVAPEVALLLCDVIATSPRGLSTEWAGLAMSAPTEVTWFSHVHITLNTVHTTNQGHTLPCMFCAHLVMPAGKVASYFHFFFCCCNFCPNTQWVSEVVVHSPVQLIILLFIHTHFFYFFIFRDGIFSAAQIATCTSSRESDLESWSGGSPGCISPSPAPESSSPCWFSSWPPLGRGRRRFSRAACPSCDASLPAASCGKVLWAEGGPASGRWAAGSRARRWPFPGGNWPPTGSRNRKWRARWRKCRSRPRARFCGSCSSSRSERTSTLRGRLESKTQTGTLRHFVSRFKLMESI